MCAIQEDEEKSNDLSNADIVTKYRTAGEIANKTLLLVCAAVKPGAKVVDLCALGDATVDEAVSKIYVRTPEHESGGAPTRAHSPRHLPTAASASFASTTP